MADFLYKGVVDWFLAQMSQGELAPGDKMPSLRKLAKQLELSLNTVIHGYELLVEEGWIESRPKSGYFVCHKVTSRAAHVLAGDAVCEFAETGQKVAWAALSHRAALVDQSDVFLNPSQRTGEPDLPIVGKGHISVREAVSEHLRKVAISVHPSHIWLSRSPLALFTQAIQTLTQSGDNVLVMTPCDPRLTATLMSLGRRVLTLASGEHGVDLDEVVRCLRDDQIALVVLPSQFSFPTGIEISNLSLRRWMAILKQVNIPAIEWDMTSQLSYKASTLMTYKSLDEQNLVVYIGGVESKGVDRNAAWCLIGQYKTLEGALLSADIALSDPQQQALLDALQPTQKNSLVRRSRQIWALAERAKSIIEKALDNAISFAQSKGGLALWVQFDVALTEPQTTQLLAKHRHGVVPGHLLSAQLDADKWLAINVTYDQLEALASLLREFVGGSKKTVNAPSLDDLDTNDLSDVSDEVLEANDALSEKAAGNLASAELAESSNDEPSTQQEKASQETVYNPMLDLINHDFG